MIYINIFKQILLVRQSGSCYNSCSWFPAVLLFCPAHCEKYKITKVILISRGGRIYERIAGYPRKIIAAAAEGAFLERIPAGQTGPGAAAGIYQFFSGRIFVPDRRVDSGIHGYAHDGIYL